MYRDFAKIYDELIIKDFNYKKTMEFINKYLNKFSVEKKNFLDNGCGTGNLTELLMNNFERGFACDISYDMISQASSKFSESEKAPQFSVQSAEEILITNGFNLIVSTMDIPNYLGESKFMKYLTNSYNSLKPNGILVFDISSEYKIKNILGNEIYINDEEELFYIWKNEQRIINDKECVDIDINFFIKNEKNEFYDRINEYQRMYVLKDDFVKKSALKAGFEIVSINDNYDDKQIDEITLRISYILRRR